MAILVQTNDGQVPIWRAVSAKGKSLKEVRSCEISLANAVGQMQCPPSDLVARSATNTLKIYRGSAKLRRRPRLVGKHVSGRTSCLSHHARQVQVTELLQLAFPFFGDKGIEPYCGLTLFICRCVCAAKPSNLNMTNQNSSRSAAREPNPFPALSKYTTSVPRRNDF